MNTKRITGVSLMLILSLLMMVTPALAVNPHFGHAKAIGPDATGNLTVDFSAGGIYYPPLTTTVSTTRDVIYACKPAEGDFPPYTDKQEVTDHNGYGGGSVCEHNSCKGSITIPPPPPPTSLTCSGDMIVALAMITYSELDIYGMFGDFQILHKKIQGTYSATYDGYTP